MTRVNNKGDAYYKSTYSNLTKTTIYVYAPGVVANNSDRHMHIFTSDKGQIHTYMRRTHDIKKLCNRVRIFVHSTDKYIRICVQLNHIKERQTYTYIYSKIINKRICA